jgi:GNAT superfamily N-acetyltransferase
MVHPERRRRGLGSGLVGRAIELSRERGTRWLHADYEPRLREFYEVCGFKPTSAGLIRL